MANDRNKTTKTTTKTTKTDAPKGFREISNEGLTIGPGAEVSGILADWRTIEDSLTGKPRQLPVLVTDDGARRLLLVGAHACGLLDSVPVGSHVVVRDTGTKAPPKPGRSPMRLYRVFVADNE